MLRFRSPKFKGLPGSTKVHARATRKEMLMALRSLLDEAIEMAEGAKKTKKRTGASVEFQ